MQGRRVYPGEHGQISFAEGDYGRTMYNEWLARPPGCGLGSLADHQVEEHEDGTITVKPSIQADEVIRPGKQNIPAWHGFLERGVWRKS